MIFIISNPNHHVKICLPVARRLQQLGQDVLVISISEFRRLPSPTTVFEEHGIPLVSIKNPFFKQLKTGSGAKSLGGGKSLLRRIVQYGIWRVLIKAKLIKLIKSSDVVCTCNDYAAPFLYISAYLNRKKRLSFACRRVYDSISPVTTGYFMVLMAPITW